MKKFFLLILSLGSINLMSMDIIRSLTGTEKNKNLNVKDLTNEIKFWNTQFHEHLLFLRASGVGNANWNNKLMEKTATIKQQANSRGIKLDDYKSYLTELQGYKEDVLSRAQSTALYNLVKHMLEELAYHTENINGKTRTAKEETDFWNNHDKEVRDLKALKPKVSAQDKQLLKSLENLGIDAHEKREDDYASKRIAGR